MECALDEFAARDFENSNLSNIVKNSGISRGSLYQYFEDKTDLYLHVMDKIKDKKMSYIQVHMSNPMDLPFFELFKKMYYGGVQFAMENPKMVRMTSHLLYHRGKIFDDVFGNNLHIALDLYRNLIERDKELGRIRKDVDTDTFANMVIDMTINVSIDEVADGSHDFNYNKMLERITLIMDIFEKGVINGEQGV